MNTEENDTEAELAAWELLREARLELAAVTEQRDGLRSGIDYASDQLHTVTEQRDELLRYNEAFRKETLICADCDAIRKEEYDQAIEQRDRLQKIVDEQCRVSSVCREYRDQRDRLAEALKRIVTIYENPEKGCIPSSSDMYDEALQSLTPNKL
jgi:DNA-binding PucR family transcriptional regulator